jgi:hypothetical protein
MKVHPRNKFKAAIAHRSRWRQPMIAGCGSPPAWSGQSKILEEDPGVVRFIRAERTAHGWEFWERSVWETDWHRLEPTDDLLRTTIEKSKHTK